MIGLKSRVRKPIAVIGPVVLCDLCRDSDAVNGFAIADPASGVSVLNVCRFCMDVATKGLARLVAETPRLMVTLGPVS